MNGYPYKYEMHLHTCPCSGGGDDVEKHIDTLMEKGFSGMVITNHFFRGDTRIDRGLPWEAFVAEYEKDFERAKAYAKDKDFDVLFGIEEHISDGNEVLVYGIMPAFLAAHPELKTASLCEYAELVHGAGGLVYQSHPFRERWYIAHPLPFDDVEILDGVEGYNAANEPQQNEQALAFASEKGLRVIAGSDAHAYTTSGRAGIRSSVRIRDNETLVRVLSEEKYRVYKGEEDVDCM